MSGRPYGAFQQALEREMRAVERDAMSHYDEELRRLLWGESEAAVRDKIGLQAFINKEINMTDPSALRREAAALLAEADRIERRPRDTFLDGTVITFTKPGRFNARDAGGWPVTTFTGLLKYAAIKAGDRPECWFLTGQVRQGKTWEGLLDFIGESNLPTVRVKHFRNGAPLVPARR